MLSGHRKYSGHKPQWTYTQCTRNKGSANTQGKIVQTECIVGGVDTELKLSGHINTVDTECQETQKAEQIHKAQCTDSTVNTEYLGETECSVDTDIKVDTEG